MIIRADQSLFLFLSIFIDPLIHPAYVMVNVLRQSMWKVDINEGGSGPFYTLEVPSGLLIIGLCSTPQTRQFFYFLDAAPIISWARSAPCQPASMSIGLVQLGPASHFCCTGTCPVEPGFGSD